MKARPYQLEAKAKVETDLQKRQSTLVVMATGLGKTVLFSLVAKDWPGRVLVMAHREELIAQAADKLEAITGEIPGIHMGSSRVRPGELLSYRIVVTSVQTMSRPNSLADFQAGDFTLIITDEAHHAPATTYRRVYDHFGLNAELDTHCPEVKHLGVTATPQRADNLAMGQIYEAVSYNYGIEPAIGDGWLVPVHQQAIEVEGLDFSDLKTLAGDFSEKELQEILAVEERCHQVAKPLVELAGDQSGLVFCVTIEHAEMMSEVINRYKPGSAHFLWGDNTPDGKRTRREVVKKFKAGEIQFLCNCMLFTEGFDAPNTAVVAMARPTKSLPLYIQVLGRGTRTLPGVIDGLATPEDRKAAIQSSAKPNMLALDFVGNAGNHKIVTAADVLGGRFGEPIRSYARKLSEESDQARPVEALLEHAKDEWELLQAIEDHKRREAIKANRARYQAQTVSPFASGTATATKSGTWHEEPATKKQVGYLISLGVEPWVARGMTKGEAGREITRLKGDS